MSQKSAPKKRKSKGTKPKGGGCLFYIGRLFIYLLQIGMAGLIAGILFFIGAYIVFSKQLDEEVTALETYRGTVVRDIPRLFDRNNQLLFEIKSVEGRRWLDYHEIPPALIAATITVEDDTFWENPGFSPEAIVGAVIYNYTNQGSRPVGASTITQQLVRHMVFDYADRVGTSYQRKIKEIFLAYILTQKWSKEQILQMYLNEIYYGNLAYGIDAASQIYLGKSATELNLAESAFLAGLPQAPIQWDPYTNFEGAKERQEFIIDLMLADGLIDYVEAEVAKGTPIRITEQISIEDRVRSDELEALHFVLYVRNYLENLYGLDRLLREGWQITTSLDLEMQHYAEQVAREHVASRQAQHNVSNASVVILKPQTGEILGMVGSLDYFNEAIDGQVNIALQPRQPGSSIKPITYATAMEKGWTTADVLWDVPIELNIGGGEGMVPVNYDGAYHGPVLFRDALANSYNIPPLQLIRDVGIEEVQKTARKMGIDSLDASANYYGLALTLGGGEVPLLEMTHAYATLANLGKRPTLLSILKIVDSKGNVIFDAQTDRLPADKKLDERIAFILSDILSDNQARTPAMGANSPLKLSFPSAVKTGTTNDYRDNWTIGYTPSVVVGVWSGNANGQVMRDSSGLFGTAPIWAKIMEKIHSDEGMMRSLLVDGATPPEWYEPPLGLERRDVCLPRSLTADGCGQTRSEWFLTAVSSHVISRIGYQADQSSMPGAWRLGVLPMSEEGLKFVTQPTLDNGYQPAPPTRCAVGSASSSKIPVQYFLPLPPHYPDEVRARLWAEQNGYGARLAPAVACPAIVTQSALKAIPASTVTPTAEP